jgi:hypothetical protein
VKPEFIIGAHNNPANRGFLENLVFFFGDGRIDLMGNQ